MAGPINDFFRDDQERWTCVLEMDAIAEGGDVEQLRQEAITEWFDRWGPKVRELVCPPALGQ